MGGAGSTTIALLAVAVPAGAQSSPADPVVTGAVQVTTNPMPVRSHTSPSIAVNPKNGRLALVESDVRGDSRACNVHVSADGGRSWARGGEVMTKPFTDCSFRGEYGPYANAAYGRDGTLYVAFIASSVFTDRERDATPRHFFLARSTDDGRTFVTTRAYEAPDGNRDVGFNKGPMLAVDPTNSDKVYVGWRQGTRGAQAKENIKTSVAATSDGGQDLRRPGQHQRRARWRLSRPRRRRRRHPPRRPLDQDRHFPSSRRRCPRAGQGDHLRALHRLGPDVHQAGDIDPGNQSTFRPPMLAADPTSSNIYVTWHGHAEVNNTGPAFQGDLNILFRASSDGGKTWGERRVINDDTGKANQFEPGISVAPNGRVDVAWFDFRNSPSGPAVARGQDDERGASDTFYSSSSDGGRTWTKNVQVSDRSSDRSIGVWSIGFSSRFNMGVASRNDSVYFAWQDSRNGSRETQSEDVYTSSLLFDDVSEESGSAGVPGWLLLGAGLAGGMACRSSSPGRRPAGPPATLYRQPAGRHGAAAGSARRRPGPPLGGGDLPDVENGPEPGVLGDEPVVHAELGHDPAGRHVLGLEDTDDPIEPEHVEPVPQAGPPALGGQACSPPPGMQAPPHLDSGKDLGKKGGDGQADVADKLRFRFELGRPHPVPVILPLRDLPVQETLRLLGGQTATQRIAPYRGLGEDGGEGIQIVPTPRAEP